MKPNKNLIAFLVAFGASFAFAQFGGLPTPVGGPPGTVGPTGSTGSPGATGPVGPPGAGLDGGPIQLAAYATSNLPDASTAVASIAYDSTLTQPTYSNGTAWFPMGKEFTMSAFRLAGAVGNTVIAENRMQNPGVLRRLTVTEAAVGVGVGTYTVDVYDATTTTVLCTSAAIACTTAVGGISGKQCSGAFTTADDIDIRVNDSACGTAPGLNVVADFGGF